MIKQLIDFKPIFDLIGFNFLVVHIFKISFVVKPAYYPITLKFCWFNRNTRPITTPWIFCRMIAKTMNHRVMVNIHDHLFQIRFIVDSLSLKWTFKQVAMSGITFVKSFCTGIKKL